MQLVRRVNLDKVPGIAETLDWSAALLALHRDHLDPGAVEETLGCLCKDQEDLTRVRARYLGPILERIDAIGQSGDGWNSDRIAQLAAQLPKGR